MPPQVKLAFSQDRALPGSELQLRVQAAPGSLCAVRAVDQSVLLMKPEAELSVDMVSPEQLGRSPGHLPLESSLHAGRGDAWLLGDLEATSPRLRASPMAFDSP